MSNQTNRRGRPKNLYLNPEVFSEFKKLAKEYGETPSRVLDRLMYEALKDHGRAPKLPEPDNLIRKMRRVVGPSPEPVVDEIEKKAKRSARKISGKA